MSSELERGDIFFFYRPRVDARTVARLEDVQRFFFVLEPDRTRRFRRIVVGRKRLPDPERHERVWAFVAEVADSPEALRDELQAASYETKTRGTRVEPPSRPAGEGRYALVDHEGHTHLAYVLELPPRLGPVQQGLRIEREASYVVAVRNPESPAPAGTGLPTERRADFPDELLAVFRGRRFAPVNPPSFLDHERAELVLIGATEHAAEELGIHLDAERERLENADLFRDLRLRPDELPTEPLEKGRWR